MGPPTINAPTSLNYLPTPILNRPKSLESKYFFPFSIRRLHVDNNEAMVRTPYGAMDDRSKGPSNVPAAIDKAMIEPFLDKVVIPSTPPSIIR
ncbi:hypothetical protein ACFXTN_023337 [Malus domestica]